jgi:hypothetical protein
MLDAVHRIDNILAHNVKAQLTYSALQPFVSLTRFLQATERSSPFTMAQNIVDAAAAVTAALAAQAATDRNDLDVLAAATEAVNVPASACSLVIAPPAPFALTSAVSVTGVVDFKTREGQKLFQTATCKLEDEPFDCDADGLCQFLKSLSARAEERGWANDTGEPRRRRLNDSGETDAAP